MIEATEKIWKFVLYLVLIVAAIVCICSIITASSSEVRLLAISVLVTIIVGGFINMWNIFHSSENITVLSDKFDNVSNKLDNLVKIKEKEVNQANVIEEQKIRDRERPVTEPLKKEFENFLSYWKENKGSIFEIVDGGKIPWTAIEMMGKEAKNIIEDNANILTGSTENEAIEIADDLMELALLIRINTGFGPSDGSYVERKERAFREGDEIVKRIKEFIEKLEK